MCSLAAMSPLNSSEVYRQLYDALWSTIFIHPGTYPLTHIAFPTLVCTQYLLYTNVWMSQQ